MNQKNDLGLYNKYVFNNNSYLSLHIIRTTYKHNRNADNLYQQIDDALSKETIHHAFKKKILKENTTGLSACKVKRQVQSLEKVTFKEHRFKGNIIFNKMNNKSCNTSILTKNKCTNTTKKKCKENGAGSSLSSQKFASPRKINSHSASMYNRINYS